MQEFEHWKYDIESQTLSYYTLDTAGKTLANGNIKQYYNCHRSLKFNSKGENKRSTKSMGSNKINKSCPARLDVEIIVNDKSKVIVKFYKTHSGHETEIGRIMLDKNTRAHIAEISCAAWSCAGRERSVRRLHADAAARVARRACVSPCALVLALLYLERLHARNKHYLADMHPQDLFLVSLMVGNKFLQDDGEDDEVICSEWAASGEIELDHLKKLEIDFLNAIEWKVFVSGPSFEAGLRRLERAVALRQGAARGFYTYSDLVAASATGGDLLRAAAAATALALAYVAGLLALLTSTVIVSHAWLPALQLASLAPVATPSTNATLRLVHVPVHFPEDASERLRCCTDWASVTATPAPLIDIDRDVKEPWRGLWSWVSTGLDPMQRWLERIDQYAEVGERRKREGCTHAWLNLRGLTALSAVSDR